MADYYVDLDLTTGDNDGGADGAANDPTDSDNWTHAWKTMADCFAGTNGTAPAAGDIVYIQGTDTVSASITTSASGSVGGGFIKFVGCADGVGGIDGTQAVIDFNGGGYTFNCNHSYLWFENFRFTNNITLNGITHAVTPSCNVWVNCQVDNVAYDGWETGFVYCVFVRCLAYNCGRDGFVDYGGSLFFACVSRDNTSSGYEAGASIAPSTFIGCIAHDNGDDGFNSLKTGYLFNSISNANVDKGVSINTANRLAALFGNRITNQGGAGETGIDFGSEVAVYGWNYLDTNTDHYLNESLAIAIVNDDQSETNSTANEGVGADAIDGYTKITSVEDFNLASGATLRRVAVTLPDLG